MDPRPDINKAPRTSFYPHPYCDLHPDLARFVQSLPKTETHIHLEGSLPHHLLQEKPLKDADGVDVFDGFYGGTAPYHAPDFRYDGFDHFSDTYSAIARQWFKTPEDYGRAAGALLSDLARQNVRYAEVSIGLKDASYIPGGMDAILKAVRKEAALMAPGIELKLFATMRRKDYTNYSQKVEEVITNPELDGVDLSGKDSRDIQDWTADVWRRAREAGKFTKAHAGEFESVDVVRHAVEELGVRRIEHGIAAAGQPEMIELLKQNDVTLDICPISNYALHAVDSLHDHPVAELLRSGVRCTVSTDDPGLLPTSLNNEYVALGALTGLSRRELAQLARNGFEAALMSDEAKAGPLAELDAIIASEAAAEALPQVPQGRKRLHLLKDADFGPRCAGPDKVDAPDRGASQDAGKR